MRDSIKQDFTKAERKAFTKARRAAEAAIKSERKAEQRAYRKSITKPAPEPKEPMINDFPMKSSWKPQPIPSIAKMAPFKG